MTTTRRKTAFSKRAYAGNRATSFAKGSARYQYVVPNDSIQSLAAMNLPTDVTITVNSPRPVSNMYKKRTLRDLMLRKGALRDLPLLDFEKHLIPPETTDRTKSVSLAAFEPDARARALLRGIEIAESDLAAAGGAYSLEQVQRIMRGVSRQAVERRVQEGSLLAVPGPSNRRRYPTIQFNSDGTIVSGLKEIQRALDFSSPWSVLSFLANPDDHLDNARPIDVLRRGNIDLVVESARRVGSQGA
jgi:hypothetical protein